MMEPQSGKFKLLDETPDLKNQSDLATKKKALKLIEDAEGKPTIFVGEVVEVKGVKFQVQRIRAIGVLVLRMVPGQKWPKEARP